MARCSNIGSTEYLVAKESNYPLIPTVNHFVSYRPTESEFDNLSHKLMREGFRSLLLPIKTRPTTPHLQHTTYNKVNFHTGWPKLLNYGSFKRANNYLATSVTTFRYHK